MRKALVISLISIHLAGNTELGQLFKLPQLVHHFLQHKMINPDLTFVTFLIQHYAGDDGTKADDDFDRQLPCHNSTAHSIASVYSPMIKETPLIDRPVQPPVEYTVRITEKVSPKHADLILQPPRHS